MNSPESPATTTTTSSPLRESTRNIPTARIMPSNSWSTTSTSPLRISRRDSPLTADSVPNHHYHKLPTQLARRQSSSYNHVKNNNLVSKSPFKANAAFRPSRIPTPSRVAMKEDENKPELGIKRRQSRGLQGLVKEQVVTKSPFLGNKRTSVIDKAPSSPIPEPLPSRLTVSHASPSRDTTDPRPSTPPPSTPRNPRIADLSGISTSPSPKPSLVSPKRFHGPRSLSASPSGESGKRQRRKTVTFDERCDVLEFDQDEVSEDVVESDDNGGDDYGFPESPSPAVSVSDGSFTSDTSEQGVPDPVPLQDLPHTIPAAEEQIAESDVNPFARTPRISRNEIRRRLMEQRGEGLEDQPSISMSQHISDISFDLSSQSLDLESSPRSYTHNASRSYPHDSRDSLSAGVGAPFDFNEPGVDLDEMHSALDRLMLGVECELGVDVNEGGSMDTETAADGELSVNVIPSTVTSDLSIDLGKVEVQPQARKEEYLMAREAEVPEVLSADEDTDEPITPPHNDHSSRGLSMHSTHDTMLRDPLSVEGSLSVNPTPIEDNDSILLGHDISGLSLTGSMAMNLSTVDLTHDDSLAARTSIPPQSARKDQRFPESQTHPAVEPSISLSLPSLSFDPSSPDISGTWNSTISTANAPRLSTAVRDDTFLSRSLSTASTATNNSVPPPVPPKDRDAILQRDEFVIARRREMREDHKGDHPVTQEGRPSKRRSLSTGDAEDLVSSNPAAQRRAGRLRDDHEMNLLDIPLEQADEEDALADVIDRELRIRRKPTIKDKNRKYQLRERENTIYASADDKISHMSRAGDVDSGKAWRTVRRPSDMNEYSRQIKEYRSQQKPGKAHGKVFVKVLGIRGLNVPLPTEPTAFTCTLNNGIHFVTTPECRLDRDSRIEQEFELIEHSKLEFTLTLKVRRDPHIAAQAKSNSMPAISAVAVPPPPPTSSRGGVRGFFGVGGSPKKAQKVTVSTAINATPEPVEDNLARYLKPDGTLARSFISFKEIAKRCDTRLFETSFPLIGQRMDRSNASTTIANPWTMGEITLQIFRLPPLPGILPDQLPQSLEECQRGLRHINWHKVTYHEGILTQCGGDCRTWRRRLLRVIGSNLVAFNDVTKKATATIDLKKATDVEDDDRGSEPIMSPGSAAVARARDEFDEVYRVERSFRLIFANDEEISFFADSDEAKVRWLEVFRALVGHIPPNPLWAELIWQRQEELANNIPIPVPTSPASRQVAVSQR